MTRPGAARGREDLVAKVVAITSGKGGVGKTTTAAAFAAGLALRGHKTVVIDFDVGLRNLDLIMGCERRVVFDFINVINGDANLNQALIKDKRNDNLYIFPTSQTRDKEARVDVSLRLTRYDSVRVARGEMMTVEDVQEILSIPLLGVIPESESVLRASNTGTPVTFDPESPAGRAYHDAVARFLGGTREMRFVKPERRNLFRV